MKLANLLIDYNDRVLVTGANGFIGTRVVRMLVEYGFQNIRCLVRSMDSVSKFCDIAEVDKGKLEFIEGNLLSPDHCRRATENVSVVFHLAAGIEKTFAGCYMNSVVATRNLLDSIIENGQLKRFVNVSSIAVYSNRDTRKSGRLDETCEMDTKPLLREEAYVYGKVKQDELLLEYAKKFKLPYVIMRPGEVFGPGKRKISGRVGIDTFGIFLHLGGSGEVPFTYVDNCAEAIVLAGITRGVDGQVFNVIDDDLVTSSAFLRMYKKNVESFRTLYIPFMLNYFLCYLWEKYSVYSNGQLPPTFNRNKCVAAWKKVKFPNRHIKEVLGWKPRIPMGEALKRYFEFMKGAKR